MKEGKPQRLSLTVVPIKVTLHPTRTKVLPGNIAYLRIENFARQEVDRQVQRDLEKLSSCDGLVLDLRANPGGSVDRCLAVAGLFLDKGVVSQLRSRVPHGPDEVIDYTLTPEDITVVTRSGNAIVSTEHRPRFKQVFVGKKIIVMVDEFTASAAEMLAAALRENNRVTLLGSRTLGKGLAQIGIPLPHGTSFSVTVGRYYTPSGYCPGDASEECGLDGRTPLLKKNWFQKKFKGKVQVETQEKLSEVTKAEGQAVGGGQSKEENLVEQNELKKLAVGSTGKSGEKRKKEQGLIPDVEMPTPDIIEYCSDNDKQLVRAAAILRGAAPH
jgi:C-terminal processing protease CtpA/Prc